MLYSFLLGLIYQNQQHHCSSPTELSNVTHWETAWCTEVYQGNSVLTCPPLHARCFLEYMQTKSKPRKWPQ